MRALRVVAPAKVNLFLRVLGRRPDGYHELETAVLPISLADRLDITAEAGPGLELSLELSGTAELVDGVPGDRTNLVVRAAAALAERSGVGGSAAIRLEKCVPSAAGLGGGSADAAATLRALNDLWSCGLDDVALREVAATVGSDVPALLGPGPCLARGRGERVEPIQARPLQWRLVTAAFGVRTADAFRWWDDDGLPPGPDPADTLAAAVEDDVHALGRLLSNDLEEPVARRHPEVRAARDALLAAGAVAAVMCGSGPTVAGLFASAPAVASVGIPVRSAGRLST
jgi:4-diphosphocytidyl-2-C-methyl-D-erythritol kinase